MTGITSSVARSTSDFSCTTRGLRGHAKLVPRASASLSMRKPVVEVISSLHHLRHLLSADRRAALHRNAGETSSKPKFTLLGRCSGKKLRDLEICLEEILRMHDECEKEPWQEWITFVGGGPAVDTMRDAIYSELTRYRPFMWFIPAPPAPSNDAHSTAVSDGAYTRSARSPATLHQDT